MKIPIFCRVRAPHLSFSGLFCIALFGCGDEDRLASTDPYNPFLDGFTTVIGGADEVPIASGHVTEDGCLLISAESCLPVERSGRYCKSQEGPVDAIVVDGAVAQVVCYEDADGKNGPTVIVDGDANGDLEIPQHDNGAVITFAPSTDGVAIKGNVTIDGNNVTLYGNGPDSSIIDGNLEITGNNARVRGIRVRGNVTIDKNTAAFVLSVVEGNLHVKSNNCLIAANDVFGNLHAEGNNTFLVQNEVAGNFQISGNGSVCEDNAAFSDQNEDHNIQPEERGMALACPPPA